MNPQRFFSEKIKGTAPFNPLGLSTPSSKATPPEYLKRAIRQTERLLKFTQLPTYLPVYLHGSSPCFQPETHCTGRGQCLSTPQVPCAFLTLPRHCIHSDKTFGGRWILPLEELSYQVTVRDYNDVKLGEQSQLITNTIRLKELPWGFRPYKRDFVSVLHFSGYSDFH